MKQMTMIAYIPVLHEGYLKLFKKYANTVGRLYVLGEEFIAEDECITREIRALKPEISAQAIRALGLFPIVEILNKQTLLALTSTCEQSIVVTDDEMSHAFAEKHLSGQKIIVETQFLRWDRKSVNSGRALSFDRESSDPFDRKIMDLARQEGKRTSDWWREVGSILVRNGEVIMQAHNRHVPSEHTQYAVGDPRDVLTPGAQSELASALHSEQAIVVNAAREGISLQGAHLYLPVFPCVICAKLVAYCGISKVFFETGHASLDGDTILRSRGVELIHVI